MFSQNFINWKVYLKKNGTLVLYFSFGRMLAHSKVRKIITIFGVVTHSLNIAKPIQTCPCLLKSEISNCRKVVIVEQISTFLLTREWSNSKNKVVRSTLLVRWFETPARLPNISMSADVYYNFRFIWTY